MKRTAAMLAFLAGLGCLGAYRACGQNSATESRRANLFTRHYQERERLSYHMKATNKDRLKTMSYEAEADGVVKKDTAGHYYEEYRWSQVIWDGQAAPVAPDFRQILSLDPGSRPQLPDLQHAGSALVGPTLDLFTFYTDLMMALDRPSLNAAGDHVYVKLGGPNSWAAGEGLILGEDSIDFDLTLKSVDPSANIATLLVRHLPPPQPDSFACRLDAYSCCWGRSQQLGGSRQDTRRKVCRQDRHGDVRRPNPDQLDRWTRTIRNDG